MQQQNTQALKQGHEQDLKQNNATPAPAPDPTAQVAHLQRTTLAQALVSAAPALVSADAEVTADESSTTEDPVEDAEEELMMPVFTIASETNVRPTEKVNDLV